MANKAFLTIANNLDGYVQGHQNSKQQTKMKLYGFLESSNSKGSRLKVYSDQSVSKKAEPDTTRIVSQEQDGVQSVLI